ncbi:MAG: TRAP transporter small permease subunit [Arhodomonas sp.]|nr:TRAP transporter small permease subunit [Arhodomonas sp.]
MWALELSTLLLGPYFMLAGPYLLHVGGHVNVDILYNRLPPRVAALVDCLTFLVIIALAVIVVRESWPVAIERLCQRRDLVLGVGPADLAGQATHSGDLRSAAGPGAGRDHCGRRAGA